MISTPQTSGARWLRLALLLNGAGLHAACLPLDDLSSYSSAWERQPSEAVNSLTPDASAPDAERGDSGADNGGETPPDAGDPREPMPNGSDGGVAPEADAGAIVDGDSPGSLDAGSLSADAAASL